MSPLSLFSGIYAVCMGGILFLLNLGTYIKVRGNSENKIIIKQRFLILAYSLVQILIGVSFIEGFYNQPGPLRRVEQFCIFFQLFLILLVLWNVYCQYWITSYNLEKCVEFVKSKQGQVAIENFKLNHRKRNHYCIYLSVVTFLFCFSLLVATTYIEIGLV